ncbi:MAG: TonB family protein [Bacteroidota bacterium]
MTNSEILRADLLDIIFENRNKDYGAYAIRNGYHNRMVLALGSGLFIIGLVVFMLTAGNHTSNSKPAIDTKEVIVIRTIEMPKEMIKEPEKPKQLSKQTLKQKPVPKLATIKYTTPPVIKKDTEVKTAMVAAKELSAKEIASVTSDGKPADNTVLPGKQPVDDPSTGTASTPGPVQPEFVLNERDPEFPGGQEGLKQFMTRNLHTPEDLQNGERKLVQIRFKVDKDGVVTSFEIVTSGGNDFDQEVVRVCKKMPRWMPAIQNGMNVPVNYVLPVTFIGAEE